MEKVLIPRYTVLMLVWACRKMERTKKEEAISQWETSSSSSLQIHIIHTHNLCPTQTLTLAALTFSPAFLAALCVSVGMFDRKLVTMHLYSQPGWEIIKFNNSLDFALFAALLVYFCTLFTWCLILSHSHCISLSSSCCGQLGNY